MDSPTTEATDAPEAIATEAIATEAIAPEAIAPSARKAAKASTSQ